MRQCKKYQKYIDMYYDNELSPDQKEDLFDHLEKCEECSEIFVDIENIEKELYTIPKLLPPDNFVTKIMHSLPEKSREFMWKERIKEKIMSPVALRINLALITVLLLFIAIRPWIFKGQYYKQNNIRESISKKYEDNVINARFYLSLPVNSNHIESVSVVGDFNGWDVNAFKLKYKGDGIWEGTFPIKPGKYEYMFVINGEKWIPDPRAKEYKEDGFGGKNSVLVL